MATLAIPALIALLFKIVLFVYAWYSPRRDVTTRLFVTLLGLLTIHNLIEVFGFNHFAAHGIDYTMERYGYTYFATAILYTAVILHVSLRISIDNWDRIRRVVPLIYLPVLILEGLLLGTNKLVAGFQLFQDYSILRVPGPLYVLFEVYMLLYALAGLVYLVYGARSSRPSVINRVRNRLWLIALVPFVLLHVYLIVANHFGLAKISSTVSVPIALTFVLIVTTYATHQYRLFDIEFFIPWSKVRKRKTAFYRRIQAAIAEIADLPSVREILDYLAKALHCQVALIGGPRPLVALVDGQESSLSSQMALSQFPREALQRVNHIVVANEIADKLPELHALMKQHKVGAIVPFNSHSATSAHWMLLGEHFSDHVYTPLDFRVVETLFDKLAERFTDNLLLLRSQLADANDELRDYKRRLAMAWQDLAVARTKSEGLETTNRELREEIAETRRKEFRVVTPKLPVEVASGEKTLAAFLEAFLKDTEATLLRAALQVCHGDKGKAARLLGIADKRAMFYLMQRHQINERDFS
jgi:DNA-binding protein Fis